MKRVRSCDESVRNECVEVGLVEGVQFGDALPVNEGRTVLVEALLRSVGLAQRCFQITPAPCSVRNLLLFHTEEYVEALARERPEERYGLAFDAHPFPGLMRHCTHVAGASLSAAAWLAENTKNTVQQQHSNNDKALEEEKKKIAICWTGGRHHARTDCASGFCFVNDVALCTLLLRRRGMGRIAYFDMDIHAGDAVEESCDEDILYCSVHLHEPGFYPYPNGARVEDNVHNFPLKRGLCDETFISLFDSRVLPLLEGHRPDVVVAQLGADGAFGDPVGQHWNLTERAFAHVSMRLRESSAIGRVLLLGGGGYHHANTARCWAHATAAALGTTCPDEVPSSLDRFAEFGPDFSTHLRPCPVMRDENK